MMIPTTIPPRLSPQVTAFCRAISTSDPVYLPYTEAGYTGLLSCHDHTAQQVSVAGGWAVFGWMIWAGYDPRLMLSAEFHSVWRSLADGKLHDISPRLGDGETVLFLPDATRKFDWDALTAPFNIAYWPALNEWRYLMPNSNNLVPMEGADATPTFSVMPTSNLLATKDGWQSVGCGVFTRD